MNVPIILIADGDAGERERLAREIGRRHEQRYRVLEASSGEEALGACRRLRDGGEAVAALIAAERLGGGGTAFLRAAHGIHPEAGRVLVSHHADAEQAVVDVNEAGIDRHVVAPWDPPEQRLHPILDEVLADWRDRASVPYTRVRDVMETDVACLDAGASLADAAQTVARHKVGDLMVVDDGAFVGVLSEGDILRASLPDLDEIVAAGGTLHDGYQLFLRRSRDLSAKPVAPLVITQPFVLHPDDHVAKAATLLIDRQIRLLPVVAGGRLVGTLSRANICRAVVEAP